MINQKRLISDFIDLVKIESISKNELKVALHLKKILEQMGLIAFFDNAGRKIGGNCGNLYAHLDATEKNKPSILLNAHIDTVVHKSKIIPIIKNGIIKSDGKTILGADCKAGVAAILEVVRNIKSEKFSHGDIKICFTVAEELGLVGAKHILPKFIKADFGIVIDGGSVEEIINRAPSQFSFFAKVIGKAAHAGVRPEEGINAIKVASQAISKMPLGRIDKETTSNIGIIKGGVATNIIPEEVEIKGEVRSHNKNKLKKQINIMTKCLSDACKKNKAALKIKVEPVYESFHIKENSFFVEKVKNSAKLLGFNPKIKMTGGGSDANIFNKIGVPCLILGVGAHKVHTSQEYINEKDLIKGTKLILEIIKTLNNS